MVTTSDPSLARTVRLLRNQGQEQRYKNEIVGFNNRMTDIHAAIGRVQLRKLENWTIKRQSNAAFYDENLKGVKVPLVMENAVHVYHQYTIRIENLDRDRFAEKLKNLGVGSGVYYPIPVHELPAFGKKKSLPVTTQICRQVLSLPVHPALSKRDLKVIVSAVNQGS
jgi:dTDP-4-amino-4,6-dideoxygalactose transaminase